MKEIKSIIEALKCCGNCLYGVFGLAKSTCKKHNPESSSNCCRDDWKFDGFTVEQRRRGVE